MGSARRDLSFGKLSAKSAAGAPCFETVAENGKMRDPIWPQSRVGAKKSVQCHSMTLMGDLTKTVIAPMRFSGKSMVFTSGQGIC